MAQAKKKTPDRVDIQKIEMSIITFNLLGTSPLICNKFQQKAWQEMLLPSRQTNRAALETKLKHDPYAEFRGSVYMNRDKKEKALLHLPSGAFHASIAAAAIDLPGAKKAQIERLTKVEDMHINLFGAPQIMCAMVRNSDISRTPDVRTRAIFPQWALRITVRYVTRLITERSVAHLVGAAGIIIGIGDWRSQKGGKFGSFEAVSDDNKAWKSIMETQGRAAQEKALATPIYFDEDTEELLMWFDEEVRRREMGDQTEGAMPKVKIRNVKTVRGEEELV